MDSNGYRLLLPEGTLDYFDLVDVQETSSEVVIYLEENEMSFLSNIPAGKPKAKDSMILWLFKTSLFGERNFS